MKSLTSIAHPNIAFIKYWGNRDHDLRIPSTGSISMNLAGLETRTKVVFDSNLSSDQLTLNGQIASVDALERVRAHLNLIRERAGVDLCARVDSVNNFPTGTGIASSASGFAALTLAACKALGLDLDEPELSRLARRGSGSASRSIPGGFVEWQMGEDDESSYAYSIAPGEHWSLVDTIAVLSTEHKHTGSRQGHIFADSSMLQPARIVSAPERLYICRQAILRRDFDALADVIELDSNMMHAVMMTSNPPLMYWLPATIAVMHAVRQWRKSGIPATYTIDAGPNVHVISPADQAVQVRKKLEAIPGVIQVIVAQVGGPARYLLGDQS